LYADKHDDGPDKPALSRSVSSIVNRLGGPIGPPQLSSLTFKLATALLEFVSPVSGLNQLAYMFGPRITAHPTKIAKYPANTHRATCGASSCTETAVMTATADVRIINLPIPNWNSDFLTGCFPKPLEVYAALPINSLSSHSQSPLNGTIVLPFSHVSPFAIANCE